MSCKSKYRRLAESTKRALEDAEEEHPLISIIKRCIDHSVLHDGNSLRIVDSYDESGSPSGRCHNRVVADMFDQSILNSYTRSIIESEFELKNRWTDVFRKLEDGPGSAKKTMKYHFSIKDRAQVKEYYRYLLYTVCKTWIHALICRAVAPFVPELKEYRTFTYSGEETVSDLRETLKTMHKTSELGAPFETYCKTDISGSSRYRSNDDRIRQLKNNKSLYIVRYVGRSFSYDVSPDRDLMIRMAATFPGYSFHGNQNLAVCIVDSILGKIPRRQWLSLFNDCEYYWGHGKIMSFPICLGKAIPIDPDEIFDPRPVLEAPPPAVRVPEGYVYDRKTALDLITSTDLLQETLKMCNLKPIETTPAECRWVKKTLFTQEIVCDRTENEAMSILQSLNDVPLPETKKLKRMLTKYVKQATADVTQWRFFVRLVQACKLPPVVSLDKLYCD